MGLVSMITKFLLYYLSLEQEALSFIESYIEVEFIDEIASVSDIKSFIDVNKLILN